MRTATAITRPNRVLDVGLAVAVVALGIGAYCGGRSAEDRRRR